MEDPDRTASLMTPAKLAEVRPKSAAQPAAWLDRMASDAGHQHVSRLVELGAQLHSHAASEDFAPVRAGLQRLAEVLPRLDFGLLQRPGLLARALGKGKNAGAEFVTQFEDIEEAVRDLTGKIKALQAQQRQVASRVDLGLLDLDMECRGIDKIMEQGARWLQDMRNQLKARQQGTPDEAAREKIAEDTRRCDILVMRLKSLRTTRAAAHQVHQQATASAGRRTALVQLLAHALASDIADWRNRLAPVAELVREGQPAGKSLDLPMESHRELQLWVKQANADCAELQAQEQALVQALVDSRAAFGAPLHAAGAAAS